METLVCACSFLPTWWLTVVFTFIYLRRTDNKHTLQQRMLSSEDKLEESVLAFNFVGSRYQSQVIRLGSKHATHLAVLPALASE